MNCLICNKSSEKSLCDDCSNKKRCKDCETLKNCNTFYSYKNGRTYSSCKECFNKKVRCEFCNKELNKSYLRSHIKKQHLYQHYNYNQHDNQHYNQHTGGGALRDLLPRQLSRELPRQLSRELQRELPRGVSSHSNNNNAEAIANSPAEAVANSPVGANAGANANNGVQSFANETNRTLIVGPSFCGKTHLLLNKLRLIRLEDPEKQIRIITRSPEQYEFAELRAELCIDNGGVSVEENVGDLEEYRGCCVVFDDMLDSNQKLIDPFFTRGRHKSCDVYYLCQSYFDAPKKTVRNNSNIIILFQQTLKDVEHIHRDISGFDMSYEEFKSLCREAWNEKFNYLLINRLEDKNGSRYRICNESNPNYKIFNPQTDPLSN